MASSNEQQIAQLTPRVYQLEHQLKRVVACESGSPSALGFYRFRDYLVGADDPE